MVWWYGGMGFQPQFLLKPSGERNLMSKPPNQTRIRDKANLVDWLKTEPSLDHNLHLSQGHFETACCFPRESSTSSWKLCNPGKAVVHHVPNFLNACGIVARNFQIGWIPSGFRFNPRDTQYSPPSPILKTFIMAIQAKSKPVQLVMTPF